MANLPTPHIKERVKVQILPSSEAQEEVELDYRIFVAGDFTHAAPGAHKDGDGSLKERVVRVIGNKRDFVTALKGLNPKLNLLVPNKITNEEDSKLEVNLDIQDMKDFHPDEIAQKVEPLRKLLEARERLKQMKMQVLRDVKTRKAVENVLKEGGSSIDELLQKLAPAEGPAGKGE